MYIYIYIYIHMYIYIYIYICFYLPPWLRTPWLEGNCTCEHMVRTESCQTASSDQKGHCGQFHSCHILPPSEIDLGLCFAIFAVSGGEHLFHRIGWKGRIWQLWVFKSSTWKNGPSPLNNNNNNNNNNLSACRLIIITIILIITLIIQIMETLTFKGHLSISINNPQSWDSTINNQQSTIITIRYYSNQQSTIITINNQQ